VYRYSDRFLTANHRVRWVDRTVQEAGETWYVIRDQIAPGSPIVEVLWRTDSASRIYRRCNGISALFLDPNPNGDSTAIGQVQGRDLTLNSPFGSLLNAVSYILRELLNTETGMFLRGVGPFRQNDVLGGGSSGGFS